MVCFAGVLSAQSSNKSKYVYNFAGGITVGGTYATNDWNERIDSMRVIGGELYVYSGGDTIPVYIPVANQSSLFDYAARKYLTDTLNISAAADTMEASWAGKVINCTSANYQRITILSNTMPVGSLVTFTKYGAGVVKIISASGITRVSVLDSASMNTVNQTYQIEFRTANKPLFIGDWRD